MSRSPAIFHGERDLEPVNDNQAMKAFVKSMERSSMLHLKAIVASGYAYGPVDENELIRIVTADTIKPLKRAEHPKRVNVFTPRQIALEQGKDTYEGNVCKRCLGTTRYVTDYSCVNCDPVVKQRERKVAFRNDVMPIVEVILNRHGLTLDDIRGDSREKDLVVCRHEIWAIMETLGVTHSEIARFFKRDHTSVRYGIAQHHARKRSSKLVRGPVQPGELWG